MATTMRVTSFYFILIYYSICTIRGSILFFFFLGKLGGLKFNTLEREREKREIERGQIE